MGIARENCAHANQDMLESIVSTVSYITLGGYASGMGIDMQIHSPYQVQSYDDQACQFPDSEYQGLMLNLQYPNNKKWLEFSMVQKQWWEAIPEADSPTWCLDYLCCHKKLRKEYTRYRFFLQFSRLQPIELNAYQLPLD